jgi:hypothetical protein
VRSLVVLFTADVEDDVTQEDVERLVTDAFVQFEDPADHWEHSAPANLRVESVLCSIRASDG